MNVRAAARYRFVLLFASLLLFLLLLPLAEQARAAEAPGAPLLEVVAFGLLLLAAVGSVVKTWTGKALTLVLALPALVLSLSPGVFASDAWEMARYVLSTAFLAYASAVLLRSIFSRREVTLDTLCAALCVYLLLGVIWALTYSLVVTLDPTAFTFALAPGRPDAGLRLGRGGSVPALYYSFCTLTTVGYGDIVPTSAPARMLACVEAILGQLYLTVLVARLVGLYSAAPAAGGGPGERQEVTLDAGGQPRDNGVRGPHDPGRPAT